MLFSFVLHFTVCDGFSHDGPAFVTLLWVQNNAAMIAAKTSPTAGLMEAGDAEVAGT